MADLSRVHTDVADAERKASLPDLNVSTTTRFEAAAATDAEHSLGLFKSLKLYKKACLWSIFFSTCIVMEGFDLTLINGLYAYGPFQEKFGVPDGKGGFQITAAWQSGLSNGALVGEILGLFLNGIIADRFGYRKTLMGALFLCLCFIFIIFFSESLVQLLVGEILIGIPWGVFQTLTTTYAAEVCPTHLRAYLTTYVNLCWVMGQFLASGVLRGMLNLDNKWGYKIPFALQWIWPVPLIIGIYLAPESPWWLVRKGRLEDAKKSLERLTVRNSAVPFNPDETISMMKHTDAMEKEMMEGTSYWDLFKGVNLRRTEIVCCVWVVQTFCGSSFMGYSTYFYKNAGLPEEQAFNMSLAQYAIGAVGVFVSWFLMDWFGRRTLYVGGQVVMCCLLLIMGFASFSKSNAASWAIGSMLLIYTFVYDSTVGPICYSLVAELPATRLRTKTVVLARNMYNITGISTNILTPRMLNPIGWNWGAKSAFFFAGTCFLCLTWTYFRLPEPKGRTYGELEVLFERGVSARKFKNAVVSPDEVFGSRENLDEKQEGQVSMVEKI